MAPAGPTEPLVRRAEAGDAAVERLRRLQLVTDAGLSRLPLDDLLNELLTRVAAMFDADEATVLLHDEDAGVLVARASKGLEEEVEAEVTIPVGAGFAGRVVRDRRPIVLPNVTAADVVNPILISKGIKSLLGVPMTASERVLGVLHVGTLHPRDFDAADVELLRLAADRMAMAIDNARLFDAERSARASAEARAERLHQIQSITDVALGYFSMEEDLMSGLLVRLRDLLGTDTAAILLLDASGEQLVARAAKGLEEEVERGTTIPVGGGFAGRIAAERRPVFLPRVNHSTVLNPILLEKGIKSLLGVPLLVEGRVIGVLHVGTLTPRVFTEDDAALLELAAQRVAIAIDRARQHGVARTLQERLLPARLPAIGGLELAARYIPSADDAHVGGDWYDVIPLDHGRVGIVMGDVVSHGVRAAAAMGQLRTALRAYARQPGGPAAVLERLNALVRADEQREMATIAYVILDVNSGAIEYSLAGHPPPLVLGDAEPRFLDGGRSAPVGVSTTGRFEEASDVLARGETLLLYTDGLIERRDEAIDHSLDRLAATAARETSSADGLCQRLTTESGARHDDVAVLVARRTAAERFELRVAAVPDSLATMRRSLRSWLLAAGADEDLTYDVLLAVGEAAANSVEHAYGPVDNDFVVTAETDGVDAVFTVADRGRWRASRGSNRGRGLALMRDLMDDVQVDSADEGTVVTLRRRLGGDGAA
jgi:serine phosphatase RsbU (regulator of sigma subunit)/anti-sigma regulatory factor (Ser/Thr protein kinase)/putative methionine-R-sulfoxide reductase with GAF domain